MQSNCGTSRQNLPTAPVLTGGANALFKDTPDFAEFKQRVFRKTGIDLNQYKQQQMHRRLLSMVERAGVGNFVDYYSVIEQNPREFAAFLDRMTINVSELFRNPEKWAEIRTTILPALGAKQRGLRIWSAGCSYGAEPYSLAILLDQEASLKRHAIHATDLDNKILAKAQEGIFTETDARNIDTLTRNRYFDTIEKAAGQPIHGVDPAYRVKGEIRARVNFRQQNLLADRFEEGYDLICCRNVVIYFTDEAKDKLYERFFRALAPGGYLFVGGTERIFNSRELGFETPMPFFYQKPRG